MNIKKVKENVFPPLALKTVPKLPVLHIYFLFVLFSLSCATSPATAQTAPDWVNNLETAYPSRDWVAVVAEGTSQPQAENAAMNALARAFRTDVASLTQSSQSFSQIIDNSAGSRNINFEQSQNFSQEINTSTNIRGLIGVQIDVYRAPNRTVYVNARMNRRECAARYSGMIRENTAIIDRLIASAAAMPEQGTFDVYARLSFAHTIAQVTDNFQNILEVLDPTAASRRPGYGGANAIRTKMLECAALITIGISIDTEQTADRTLFARAAGSFFRDLGFRISEQAPFDASSAVNYVLRANARFETISQNVVSCRYYLDAAMEQRNGAAIFTFTEDDRKAHPNSPSEARRLAVRAVETSLKEGKFAIEFNSWLGGLIE